MWVILTYDIAEKRVNKIRKTCLPFLRHVQKSVFEGEISRINLKILVSRLSSTVISNEDSVRLYLFRDDRKGQILQLGREMDMQNII